MCKTLNIPIDLPEKTEPGRGWSYDPKVYQLLVNEELGRKELESSIKKIQDGNIDEGSYVEQAELVFVDIEEYMTNVRELADLLKSGKI
jgi:hypothetical protein